jgi:CHAT domain-containing protein/predicted negative regulator of RcsB-dependent stress response
VVVAILISFSLAGCSRRASLRPDQIYQDARNKFERGELVQALNAADHGYDKSQKSEPEWSSRFRVLKGEILVWQGKSKDALAVLEAPLPSSLDSDEIAVRRLVAQSLASTYIQKFEAAQSYLVAAAQTAESHQPSMLGEVTIGGGTLALMRGDFANARKYYAQALHYSQTNHRKFLEGNALGSLGWAALRQQHFDEAIDWFTRSLSASREIGNKTQIAKTSGNLGFCYYKMGDYERALEAFTESESTSAELGLARDQLTWLDNIGQIHYEQRDYGDAESYYRKALEIARGQENKALMAVSLTNVATIAIHRGQFDSAAQYNDEALRLKREVGDKSSELYTVFNQARIAEGHRQYSSAIQLLNNIIRDSGDDASLRWEAETNLAGIYAAEGKTALADAQYRKALSTIDNARSSHSKEEHRLSFLATATRFYNDDIDFLVSHNRAREALAVAEHSRARTLAEGLKVPVSQLSGAAFHPEQNARKLNSVVLAYWLKPERSYLWVVTPNKVELFPLAGQDEIDATVEEYRKALLGPRRETASAPGQKLYQLLLAPAAKLLPTPCPTSAAVSRCGQSAPRIIVIADGSLLSLNFETLLVPTPQPHYWIEDATISNASSIALLGARNRALPFSRSERVGLSNSTTAPNLLLIGDPVYTGTEFPKLAQAKLEIERVESYFSPDARSVIDGANAKPTAYAGTKPVRYEYIHFVAHGTASRVSPLDSSIVLSKEGDAYKLYARDIMAQPLRANLVTISACYGAGNRAYSGEGLVGLSWAFLRAGAHNVIAALWEVNDASTPQLMDNLYLNVKNGEDPATALRTAKLAMLRSESIYRRPFYWGAFQLYIGS